jgi:hypothetical protein
MANKDENRSWRMTLRFKPAEFKLIENRYKRTRYRSVSEYSRNVLLEKNITVTHRDRSMDDVLEELILLRKELNFIGNNFNQTVRKLNSINDNPNAEIWQAALIILRDKLEPSIREIKERINKYSDLWSQKLLAEKA